MNPVQTSRSKKFGVRLFNTLSKMVSVIAPEGLDISSEHRDEPKLKEFPEHRDESKLKKVITNIETGQNQEKSSRRSRWANKSQTRDEEQNMRQFLMSLLDQ